MSYDNTNRGTLGKNKNRKTEKHPEYNGSLNVGGTDYWISGWIQTNKQDGSKFFSLSVKPKDERGAVQRAAVQPANDDFIDSDIPF